MSRLTSFLTALWVSSAAAQFGFVKDITNAATREVQAVSDPVGKGIAFIGGSVCNGVKPILGVSYDSYDEEPDMSKLTLVYQNRAKTVIYNLTLAPSELPKDKTFKETDSFTIYFHGFTDNPTKSSFQTMNEAFSTQDDVYLMALDASSLIKFFYLRATTMVRFIGEQVGEILAALVHTSGLNPANIHLIGHSLGSHISGFTGKTFKNLTGSRIGRISGLDPAGPCFTMVDEALRLSAEDADFVDVMHTDAGVYGINKPCGHVDFYPNGGSEQPLCLLQTCSHSRAWEYYAESVTNRRSYIGVKCSDYEDFRKERCDDKDTSLMGYHVSSSSRGRYDLQTGGEEPFGLGERGLRYQNNVGIARNVKDSVSDVLFG